jgi:pimeloyl-ACP methyl ester carboxylesterase
MSTSIAQRFALDYPERTRGLVLMGSFVTGWQSAPVIVEFWEAAVSKLTDPIDPAFVREFQESTLAQPVPEAFLDTVVQESLKVPARVWRAVFRAFLEADFAPELGKIKAPTPIIWGDQDTLATPKSPRNPHGHHRGLAVQGISRRRTCLSLGRTRALRGRSCGFYRKRGELKKKAARAR